MEHKMSRWGIGPLFAGLSLIYFLVMAVASRTFYLFFNLDILSNPLFRVAGVILIIVGIPFLILALFSAHRAYNAGRLVTGGVFSLCRNPIYASWVVFIVPGLVLFQNSWLVLTSPIFMYIILINLVQIEEKYLEKMFGDPYLVYKKRVPCILPYGFIKSVKI